MSVGIDKLLKMAEQITDNMRFTEDVSQVAAKTADHINRFWDPRMKESLVAYVREGDGEVSVELKLAVESIVV